MIRRAPRRCGARFRFLVDGEARSRSSRSLRWPLRPASGCVGGAPSGLVNLAHLPQKRLGEVGVTDGSRLDKPNRTGARRGAPPPTPPRSFLTERGERRSRWGRIGSHPHSWLDDRHRTVSPGAPLSRPLPPPNCRGERRNSIPLRQGASHLPPPRSLRGRAGEGGAHHPAPPHPKHLQPCPTAQPPSLFWGRCEPERAEGAPAPRAPDSEAPQPPPCLNLSRQFRGRWAGGAGAEGACAEPSEAPPTLPYSPISPSLF